MRISVLLTSLLALSACGTMAPPDVAFDAKEAAYINTQGKATIEGHAFLSSRGGKVMAAAGETVRLVPATTYARKRFALLFPSGKFRGAFLYRNMEANEEYAALTRSTKAESNGRFTFEHVAPGDYFVATQKAWVDAKTQMQEGGAFYETVTITGKESDPVAVIVSGK
ncbi:MAG: putative lipoprotein [Hyphomicrobiales bacterium]|nr:putative lipoprotein [Hyphomicrobiales bacterium]